MQRVTVLAYSIHNCPLQLADCIGLIAPARLEQVSRFRPADQLRSLCGDLLVRMARANYTPAPPLPLSYATTEQGKPFLPAFPRFHFNVSHSGDWVLCATASRPVGIDIQQERPFRPALPRRALSDREQAFWNTITAEKQSSAFFDLWCLKEAYCKATGLGLTKPLDSFSISLDPLSISDDGYSVSLISFPNPSYHVGLCIAGSDTPEVELRIVTSIK